MISLFKRKPQEEPRYTEAALRQIEAHNRDRMRGRRAVYPPYFTLNNGMMGTIDDLTEQDHRPFSFKAEWRGKMRTFYVPTFSDGSYVFIDETTGEEYRQLVDSEAWGEIRSLLCRVELKDRIREAEVL